LVYNFQNLFLGGGILTKRTLGLWDIVLMNVTAIIGLRWLPIAASYGASAILFWLLAAVMFFIPHGLVSAELATTYPEEGGLFVWVEKAFGQRWGFLTSWFYWINNLFYYPSLLTFIAVTLSYVVNPNLQNNKLYVALVILIVYWGVTLLNLRGTRVSKWLSDMSGTLGTILPGLVLIILSFITVFVWKRPIPTDYSLSALFPHASTFANVAFLSTIMFGMAGMELSPTLAGETKNPQRTFALATIISAFIIAGVYILGTVAITFMVSPDKIGAASGIMQAIEIISSDLHLGMLVPAIALMLLIGNLGGLTVWTIGPIKMLFESTKQGILPEFFTKLNKYDVPQNAMISQAVLVSLIVLITSFMPTVEGTYEVLVMMTTITYFIPYIFMFLAFLTLRRKDANLPRPFKVPGGNVGAYIFAGLGLFSVLLALILPLVPAQGLTRAEIVIYEMEVAGGPIVFGIIGMLIYQQYLRRKAAQVQI
jgi:amino acid transporter